MDFHCNYTCPICSFKWIETKFVKDSDDVSDLPIDVNTLLCRKCLCKYYSSLMNLDNSHSRTIHSLRSQNDTIIGKYFSIDRKRFLVAIDIDISKYEFCAIPNNFYNLPHSFDDKINHEYYSYSDEYLINHLSFSEYLNIDDFKVEDYDFISFDIDHDRTLSIPQFIDVVHKYIEEENNISRHENDTIIFRYSDDEFEVVTEPTLSFFHNIGSRKKYPICITPLVKEIYKITTIKDDRLWSASIQRYCDN